MKKGLSSLLEIDTSAIAADVDILRARTKNKIIEAEVMLEKIGINLKSLHAYATNNRRWLA